MGVWEVLIEEMQQEDGPLATNENLIIAPHHDQLYIKRYVVNAENNAKFLFAPMERSQFSAEIVLEKMEEQMQRALMKEVSHDLLVIEIMKTLNIKSSL